MQVQGITGVSTINSLLSQPERHEAVTDIRMGRTAILIISPEQLRSPIIRRSIEQRQIGAWVLDEAHCLSKWGHDFRPDYRYIGRFINRYSPGPPPVLCLTATAKPEVKAEIKEYFQQELSLELT